MSNVEYIAIVDSQDRVIGKKPREELGFDDIYRVSSLWVFNNNKDLLIAQRPLWKSHDPGKWTESAVGTVAADETYESNLVKEAQEELGLKLSINNLVFIAKEYYESKNGKMYGAMYATVLNERNPELHVDTDEVPRVEWLSYSGVKEKLNHKEVRLVESFEKFYFQVWDVVSEL